MVLSLRAAATAGMVAALTLPLLFACARDNASEDSRAESIKATGTFEARVTLQADKPGRNVNPAVLGSNVQWVDHGDELLDHSGRGFDSAMLNHVKALAPTMLRYPGGSLSDLYHWRDGVGDLGRRGYNEHFYSKAMQKIVMGTQEFLELCEAVGAEPLITVNTATGSAEEAAGWVTLVNKTRLISRVTGKQLPKVKFWEIGNEPYLKDDGQKKLWMQPEAFGAKAGQMIRAMKAVDPSIEVGIPLRSDTLGRIPATPYPGFNEKALKAVGANFEFVALHNAYSPLAMDKNYRDEQLAMALLSAAAVVRTDFEQTRKLLKQLFPDRKIRLAVTEYNALYSLGGKPSDQYISTLGGALIVADLVREFAETPDLEFANFWSLSGNWHFGAISNEGRPRPAYYVLQLYRQALQGRFIPASVEVPVHDAPDIGLVPAASKVPLISALATSDGRKIRLVLINKDPVNPAKISASLSGAPPVAQVSRTVLSGQRYFSTEVETTKNALGPGKAGGGSQQWQFEVPPHSMTVVEFSAR